MPDPILLPGQYGSDLIYTELNHDDFTGSNGPAAAQITNSWEVFDMSDGLHRAGNPGQDRDGNVSGDSVDGKRWSAWYDAYLDQTLRIENNQLQMGGHLITAADPTRDSYTQNGQLVEWNTIRAHTAMIGGWSREYQNDLSLFDENVYGPFVLDNGVGPGGHMTSQTSPNKTYSPGTYFEMRVSFAQMFTQSFRLSWWLMPAYEYASDAYVGNADAVEIDIFEYDPTAGHLQTALCKVIGGSVGNTPGDQIDLTQYDLRNGYVTFGLLWLPDKLVWYCEGVEIQRDEIRVPQVPHYVLISREINSGVRSVAEANQSGGVYVGENLPKIPWDWGLWGENAWFQRANINTDIGLVDYHYVWNVSGVGPGPDPDPDPVVAGRIVSQPAVSIL